MRCHYCEREAAFTAETNGLRVGLCDRHLRERFDELADANALGSLRRRLGMDRA